MNRIIFVVYHGKEKELVPTESLSQNQRLLTQVCVLQGSKLVFFVVCVRLANVFSHPKPQGPILLGSWHKIVFFM